MEGDILPRFLVSHHAGPVPPSFVSRLARPSLAEEFGEFLRFVRAAPSRTELDDYLDGTIERGYPVEAVFDDLVTPVARRMGVLWEEDECDFFEVTVVCTRLQAAIRRLSSRYRVPTGHPKGRILVGGLPGAEHSLGFLLVAECFARNGYAVDIGEPLVHGIHPGAYDVLALSVSRSEESPQAREWIRRARGLAGEDLKVIVGGFAFRSDPGLVEELGADGWAESPEAALRLIEQMIHPETTLVPQMMMHARHTRA